MTKDKEFNPFFDNGKKRRKLISLTKMVSATVSSIKMFNMAPMGNKEMLNVK